MFLLAGSARPCCVILVLGLFSASTASSQQLPDNNVFLRTRERILADVDRMPRYTCVQTITRRYYRPRHHGASCDTLMTQHKPEPDKALLHGWDRLRVEIAVVNGNTSFSWAGAPEFESDALDAIQRFAGQGPFNTGDFVAFLHAIFNQAIVSFDGEESAGQHRLLAYTYKIPLERSGYRIKDRNGWTPTAYEGKLLLDPDALDIASLTVRTAELSEANPDCQAISQIDYGRIEIHERMVLIPRQTELVTISRDGSESHSLTTYASCREYGSKARLFLDGSAPSARGSTASASSGPPDLLHIVPAGLHFRARILTPIDSNTSAAGDPIEAVLVAPIRDKNKVELAPAGARLHGRLLTLEQRLSNQDYFLLAFEFESIELKGRSVPLHVAPDTSTTLKNMNVLQWQRGKSNDSKDDVVPDNRGYFVVRQEHLHLENFESSWTTLFPAAKNDAPPRAGDDSK